MREYLLLFWNQSGDGQYDQDPAKMQEGMEAWKSWIGNIAMQGKLISTKPIQWEGVTIDNGGIENRPVIKEQSMVTGYLICKSEDKAEVVAWSKSCPILAYPNGSTEIREVLPFDF